jgi:hypothetical protein
MSDGNGHKPQLPSTVISLTILFDQTTGAVNVNGPVDNALMCYGLLESAKDAIRQHVMQKAMGQRIVPSSTLPFLKQ